MLVSVIITTYRRVEMFFNALNSVLSQDYMNIEVIVVDDNIEKHYSDKILEYIIKTNNEKIKYYKTQKNLGAAMSRNLGVMNSNGEYISFLDDDDIYLKNKISRQIEAIIQNDYKFQAVFSRFEMVDIYNNHIKDSNFISGFSDSNEAIKYHLLNTITGLPTLLIKKENFLLIDGFRDVPSSQDYILILDLLSSGVNLLSENSILVRVIEHEDERITTSKKKNEGNLIKWNIQKNFFQILTKKEIKAMIYNFNIYMSFSLLKYNYFKSLKYYFKAVFLKPLNIKNIKFVVLHLPYRTYYRILRLYNSLKTRKKNV